MTRAAQVRDAAAKAVLERHPYLDQLVDFDIAFNSVSVGHCGFDLLITIRGYNEYKRLRALIDEGLVKVDRPITAGEGALSEVLDHYCVNDPDDHFVLDKAKWMIGSCDDSLALTMVSSYEARLWVRTWWNDA